MDKKFDYSEFELGKLTYSFAELTAEQADEKRALYEQYVGEKDEAKAALLGAKAPVSEAAAVALKRPVFRPTAKPSVPLSPPAEPANSEGSSIEHPLTDATPDEMQQIAQGGLEAAKHPVFKPTKKPGAPTADTSAKAEQIASEPVEKLDAPAPVAKPAGFRPTIKPPVTKAIEPETEASVSAEPAKPKPAFRPTMKPPQATEPKPESKPEPSEQAAAPKPKPAAFRPTMKPAKLVESEPSSDEPVEAPKPKPATFRPTMKPAATPPKPAEEEPLAESKNPVSDATLDTPSEPLVEPVKPKPAFRPTMKPRPKPDDETLA